MAGIGHNRGPELERSGWKVHCWKTAREALLPHLPIEVVRRRVARAKELGLQYKTYAGIRAATGHDVIAFLFSENALRPDFCARLPEPIGQKLEMTKGAERLALSQVFEAHLLVSQNQSALDDAHLAPSSFAKFSEIKARIGDAAGKRSRSGIVLVTSDAPWEQEWLAAGKLGAQIDSEKFFEHAMNK